MGRGRLASWFGYHAAQRETARNHRVFLVLLATGLVLRILTVVAYWPGVQFPDSGAYLQNAAHLGVEIWHPMGYPLFLALFAWTHQIAVVTVVQHLLGLVAGGLVYVVLLRLGCRRGWAALGCAPFLLDPMQVYLEQYVLSDSLFTFLIVTLIAAAVLYPLTPRLAPVLGLLIAYTTMVRTIAIVAAVPLVAYWVWQRAPWRNVLLAAITAALPLLGYAAAFDASHGAFSMQGFSGRWLYGRVAAIAHCGRDHVPAASMPMCPRTPPSTRVLPSEWVWNPRSPYTDRRLPADPVRRSQLAARFAHAVILHEPFAYARTVARDVAYAFAPGRETGTQGWFTGSWRFYQPHQPVFWRTKPIATGFWGRGAQGVVLRTPAKILHDYERFVFTPGPAGALALACACVAAVVRRRERTGAACALLAGTGLLLLVVPIATVDLDYRYVLSAQELFLAAGALGASALAPAAASVMARMRLSTTARRRALAVAIAAGLAAGNLLATEAYANGVPVPKPLALGETAVVGGRIAVQAKSVDIVDFRCFHHAVYWRYQFDVQARWLRGRRLVVAADDFTVPGKNPFAPYRPAGTVVETESLLHPYLVSRGHPTAGGLFVIDLPRTGGTLDYIDPLGAGDAAWRFHAPPSASDYPPAGSFCLGTLPLG